MGDRRAARRSFRPGPGRAHVALAALPFAKVTFDFARGVPEGSFLWQRARGLPQDLGSFQLGFGVSWGIPKVQLALGALSGGLSYTQSAADLAAAFLMKRVAAWAPGAIAVLLLTVAALRLALRAVRWRRAEAERRELVAHASISGWRRVGWRRVALLVSDAVEGSPFTGGILAPYVGFPRRAWDALRPEKRRAALAHEIAHVAEHHLSITTLVGIVRDVFWFVPFLGAAERRLREACELAADARAVERGTAAEWLASALVRVREAMPGPTPARAATLAATDTPLAARVAWLLDARPRPRLGFQYAWPRVALTLWLAASALVALAFGNH